MSRIARTTVALFLGAMSSTSWGCAHAHPVPAAEPVAETKEPTSTTQTTSQVTAAPPPLTLSDTIQGACKIDVDNIATAPKFDFDKSNLLPEERTVLQQVAKCVTTGPLKGRSLHLVGRADPRGELEYNFALGGYRAGSVQAYLEQLGVDPAKLTTTSRGKLDATGTDEAGWQLDRRVDIDLQ